MTLASHIYFELNDKQIELTREEAQRLYDELKKLLFPEIEVTLELEGRKLVEAMYRRASASSPEIFNPNTSGAFIPKTVAGFVASTGDSEPTTDALDKHLKEHGLKFTE